MGQATLVFWHGTGGAVMAFERGCWLESLGMLLLKTKTQTRENRDSARESAKTADSQIN